MNFVNRMLVHLLRPQTVMHLKALDHYINGEKEIKLLKALVDPKKNAIDAGANIGTYSYFLRKYANRVYAYEPNPELAARLGRLLPDITVRQVALSDKSGDLKFSIPKDASGQPQHELGSVAQNFIGATISYSVQCITLDSESVANVGFIKIDVEQHEREVLRGGINLIEKCRPVILVEVYPLLYNKLLSEEFSFILNRDYCAWFYFANAWLPLKAFRSQLHAAPENFGSTEKFMGNNLIFFPNEHRRAVSGPRSGN